MLKIRIIFNNLKLFWLIEIKYPLFSSLTYRKYIIYIIIDLNAHAIIILNRIIQLMSQIKPNIPILQEAQVWKRNQKFKHWGRYKVFKFVSGQPTYLLTSYFSLFLLILFALAFLVFILADFFAEEIQITSISFIIRAALLTLQLYFSFKFYKTDPGIISHSMPLINELELTRLKNFCEKCKCMQSEAIKHCQLCDVCIQDTYVHASVLKTCITQKNIKCFCGLWLTIFAQSAIYLYRIF